MRRILEIIAQVRDKYFNDDFFSNFEYSCRISPIKRKYFRAYNKALMVLDNESWQILKEKALKHYRGNHREGQRKQGFFKLLDEAFAYRYLVAKGFKNVRFVKEENGKTPDINFTVQNMQSCCEVKTLGISKDEINRRSTPKVYDGSVYASLSDGFLNKFSDAVNKAKQQLHAFGTMGLVYIIIRFDYIALDYYQNYRKQLITFSEGQRFDNLLIKIGLLENRRISHNISFHRTF